MTLQFEVLRISIICCQQETSLTFSVYGKVIPQGLRRTDAGEKKTCLSQIIHVVP
jgi:hypothetical protein